jgi:hypothetical protein
MKKLEHIEDAKTLATFANIESQASTEYFQHNYPDFLPADIWSVPQGIELSTSPLESSRPSLPLWKLLQESVRGAWQSPNRFPLESCIELIGLIAKHSEQSKALDLATKQLLDGVRPEILVLPAPEVWPVQRAIMFLGINPWRASLCRNCGNRFVKDKSTRQFCSDKCFQESRKVAKQTWWAEHGTTWRNESKKKSKSKKRKNP